jgi:putative ABC transport system permease protein
MNYNKFKDLLKLTVKNIFRRKVRSILTMLSIIIGIGAVMALILLTNGLLNGVEAQFETMGSNTILITPSFFVSGGATPNENSTRLSDEDALRIKDTDDLKKISDLEEVYYFSYKTAEVEYKNKKEYTLTMMTDSDDIDGLLKVMDIGFEEGNGFNKRTGRKVIVGNYFAKELFDKEINIGNTIKINGEEFKVIAILEPVGNIEEDKSIYISRKEGEKIFNIDDKVNQIVTKSADDKDVDKVKEEIEDVLEKNHNEDAFIVITAKQMIEMFQRILNILKTILISIASISVIVASIGIMNSIYTSVLERIKEIGVLKSIGAKLSDIVFLFVSESIILSLVGGFIGLGFGYGIAKFVEIYLISQNFDILHIVVSEYEIILTFVLSLVIGFISGILPAKKASKLKPVDALRNNF